jgi:hypothetical protein
MVLLVIDLAVGLMALARGVDRWSAMVVALRKSCARVAKADRGFPQYSAPLLFVMLTSPAR